MPSARACGWGIGPIIHCAFLSWAHPVERVTDGALNSGEPGTDGKWERQAALRRPYFLSRRLQRRTALHPLGRSLPRRGGSVPGTALSPSTSLHSWPLCWQRRFRASTRSPEETNQRGRSTSTSGSTNPSRLNDPIFQVGTDEAQRAVYSSHVVSWWRNRGASMTNPGFAWEEKTIHIW